MKKLSYSLIISIIIFSCTSNTKNKQPLSNESPQQIEAVSIDTVQFSLYVGNTKNKAVAGVKIYDDQSNTQIGVTQEDGYFYANLLNGTKIRVVEPDYGISQSKLIVSGKKVTGIPNLIDPVATWWPVPVVTSDDVTRVMPSDFGDLSPSKPSLDNPLGWDLPNIPQDYWTTPLIGIKKGESPKLLVAVSRPDERFWN